MRRWLIGVAVLAMAIAACGRSGPEFGAGGGSTPTPTGSPTPTPIPTATAPIGNGDGLDGSRTINTNPVVVNTCAVLVSASGTTATVSTATAFTSGRAVVVHQVQDDLMTAYGSATDVTALFDGGRAEITRISSVAANTLTLAFPLVGNYGTTGASRRAQACTVPQYADVTITGTGVIRPPNGWNGETGGLVVFLVQGTLNFVGRVDVRGGGFRGGAQAVGSGGTADLDGDSASGQGAFKGEGLDAKSWTRVARGNLANGAGGGNDNAAGGAGGANGGAGGRGGDGSSTDRFGEGGAKIVSTEGMRLIFGGGGGGGEQDATAGTGGGRGGGAVLIRANIVIGDGGAIEADGGTAADADDEGAGGGGAGGTIVFLATNPTAFIGSLDADGGDGGGSNGGSPGGPGGGGGGGRVHAPSMGGVVISVVRGDNGAANGSARNSTAGQPGVVLP